MSVVATTKKGQTCSRCKRELRHWPLERGTSCSPRDWFYCIRPVAQ